MSWEKKYFYHYHFYLFLTPVYILLMQFSALEITPFAPLFHSTDPFCQAFSNSGLGNEREKCHLLGLVFWIMVFVLPPKFKKHWPASFQYFFLNFPISLILSRCYWFLIYSHPVVIIPTLMYSFGYCSYCLTSKQKSPKLTWFHNCIIAYHYVVWIRHCLSLFFFFFSLWSFLESAFSDSKFPGRVNQETLQSVQIYKIHKPYICL